MTLEEARKLMEAAKEAEKVIQEADAAKKKLADCVKKTGFDSEIDLARAILDNLDPRTRSALFRSYATTPVAAAPAKRGKRVQVTEELKKKAKELYKQYQNYSKVGRELGCTNITAKKMIEG